MRDLLVIGGGPVGLATSLYAAELGLDVAVLEPRLGAEPTARAIDKACGEGLMPGGLQALAALGVDPIGLPLKGIRYVGHGRQVETDFARGVGRGVRRTALHRALVDAVEAAGIAVEPLRADLVSQDEGGATVVTRHPRGGVGPVLRARHVVAADGLHSPTRRTLGLEARARPGGTARHGLRRHSGIRPWSEHVEVHWSGAGEAYVTPVSPDVVGVAVLTERREPFEVLLAAFPELAERLAGGPVLGGVLGAGPFRQKAVRRVAGRVLLVGDASGYVDALTGEGISVGLAQAREAVRAVASGRPEAYERAWRRVTWRSAALTQVLVQATRIRLGRRLIVPAAEHLPALFGWAVDELSRPL